MQERITNSHKKTINALRKAKINVQPSPIYIVDQESLQDMQILEREYIETKRKYIEGMYSTINDIILLDKDFSKKESETRINYVIGHEYMHKIIRDYTYAIEEKHQKKSYRELTCQENLHDPTEDIIKNMINFANRKLQLNPTEEEERYSQFLIYIEESFAIAGGLYLVGEIRDDVWTLFSKNRIGKTLKKDKEFTSKLEKTLKASFFDTMFTHGLKETTIMYPIIKTTLKKIFKNRYKKLLENKIVTTTPHP
jgi:hypothetical protein